MIAKSAKRTKCADVTSRLRMLLPLVMALSLTGCGSVDSMLFGGDDPSEPVAASDAAMPEGAGALDGDASSSGDATAPVTYKADASSVPVPVATITPVNIEPGSNTGTAVSKTTAGLRAQLVELQKNIQQNATGFARLRQSGAAASVAYHEYKAHITTRLQIGTTRGNPELVAEWNRAQTQLDTLTSNINALNGLAKQAASDASSAHYTLDQIASTLEVSGAVDEDHRQLRVLQDETSQTIVVIDRLLREVSDAVQRQTAYVANERGNLTALAGAIKSGQFYGTDFGTQVMSQAAGPENVSYAGAAPLLVIRFDRQNVNYQDVLYTALRRALQSHPNASFKVVGVAPKGASIAAVQLAQSSASRHAQDVMQSITDMGVPPSRLTVGSETDPAAAVSEVKIYLR